MTTTPTAAQMSTSMFDRDNMIGLMNGATAEYNYEFFVEFARRTDKRERNKVTGEMETLAKKGDIRIMRCTTNRTLFEREMPTPKTDRGPSFKQEDKNLISVCDLDAKDAGKEHFMRSFGLDSILAIRINGQRFGRVAQSANATLVNVTPAAGNNAAPRAAGVDPRVAQLEKDLAAANKEAEKNRKKVADKTATIARQKGQLNSIGNLQVKLETKIRDFMAQA